MASQLASSIAALDGIISAVDERIAAAQEHRAKGSVGAGSSSGAAGQITAPKQPPVAAASEGGSQEPVAGKAGKAGKAAKKQKTKTATPKAPETDSQPANAFPEVAQADFRVGTVIEVEAVENSTKLWKCQVDVGEDKPRQVITGLQQVIPLEAMRQRRAVLICNLKPAKLAGQVSEAMILAASADLAGAPLVETLTPPAASANGSRVGCRSCEGAPAPPKTLKSKVWEQICASLQVEGKVATFKGEQLGTSDGSCSVTQCPDGSKIK